MKRKSLPRRGRTARRYAELAETARAWLDVSRRTSTGDEATAALVHAVESAVPDASPDDLEPSTRLLESLVPEILRHARRSRLDLESARPRARARVARTLACVRLAEAERLSRDPSVLARLHPAREAFSTAERLLESDAPEPATVEFRRATGLLDAVIQDTTLSAIETRLGHLRPRDRQPAPRASGDSRRAADFPRRRAKMLAWLLLLGLLIGCAALAVAFGLRAANEPAPTHETR